MALQQGERYHCPDPNCGCEIQIFSTGCPVCEETVTLVKQMACPSCEVTVLDMQNPDVARRARSLGVRSVPAVVINGQLADCCAGRGPGPLYPVPPVTSSPSSRSSSCSPGAAGGWRLRK